MNKVLNEQLSAFLDDELDDAELDLVARRLATDTELRTTALSYTLIGDVLRGELPEANPVAFNRRVSVRASGGAAAEPGRIAGHGLQRWGRMLAGSGVAAAVAIVAVVALRNGDPSTDAGPALTVPVADQVQPAATYTVPAAFSRRAGAPDRLSRYYLNHSEYAHLLGGQGSLVRIVSGPEADEVTDDDDGAGESPVEATTEP